MTQLLPSPVIHGVATVHPTVHHDDRGRFVESYRQEWFAYVGPMVQANHAERQAGAIVGLHYHRRQTDYWYVARGHARAVLHDLRRGSPTEGATLVTELGEVADAAHNHVGLLIPPGVAHGFAAITDLALTYLVDAYYDPTDELGLAWDDPAVGVDWGIADPYLSERDRTNPKLVDIRTEDRPAFDPLRSPALDG